MWLRDPQVCFHFQARGLAIDKILQKHSTSLTQWERNFLHSVRKQRKLSEKQRDRLNAISLKTIDQRICASTDQSNNFFSTKITTHEENT